MSSSSSQVEWGQGKACSAAGRLKDCTDRYMPNHLDAWQAYNVATVINQVLFIIFVVGEGAYGGHFGLVGTGHTLQPC